MSTITAVIPELAQSETARADLPRRFARLHRQIPEMIYGEHGILFPERGMRMPAAQYAALVAGARSKAKRGRRRSERDGLNGSGHGMNGWELVRFSLKSAPVRGNSWRHVPSRVSRSLGFFLA